MVILLVDDLGWGDVGYHNENVVSPHIDGIAAQGVEFDRFYVNPTLLTQPSLAADRPILYHPWR
mgnify:CR=1 FL=1